MCVLCDGWSEEELLAEEFMRIAMNGYTMVSVESSPEWTYTIGLVRSFDHPELVVTGAPMSVASHLLAHVTARIKAGDRFDASSPAIEPCDCGPLSFGPVHNAQWERGRFDQWLRYYDWYGGEPPPQRALQVLWSDDDGLFPPHPDFCCGTPLCQPLLDGVPRHNANLSSREARRRQKYGHGKRRRK